jgi:hypothetical protein
MDVVRVESLGARVRREADRRGTLNLHRYIIVERDAHMIRRSPNFEFPYSFSLDGAEAYLARRL